MVQSLFGHLKETRPFGGCKSLLFSESCWNGGAIIPHRPQGAHAPPHSLPNQRLACTSSTQTRAQHPFGDFCSIEYSGSTSFTWSQGQSDFGKATWVSFGKQSWDLNTGSLCACFCTLHHDDAQPQFQKPSAKAGSLCTTHFHLPRPLHRLLLRTRSQSHANNL